jgi:hypothetical protein
MTRPTPTMLAADPPQPSDARPTSSPTSVPPTDAPRAVKGEVVMGRTRCRRPGDRRSPLVRLTLPHTAGRVTVAHVAWEMPPRASRRRGTLSWRVRDDLASAVGGGDLDEVDFELGEAGAGPPVGELDLARRGRYARRQGRHPRPRPERSPARRRCPWRRVAEAQADRRRREVGGQGLPSPRGDRGDGDA